MIVGGGTAGAVLANRLTEDRNVSVAVIEGGPTDVATTWCSTSAAGSRCSARTSTTTTHGAAAARQLVVIATRARVLGGCSSHNTLISFRPFNADLDDWRQQLYGCPSWNASNVTAVRRPPQDEHRARRPAAAQPGGARLGCSPRRAPRAPVLEDLNAHIVHRGGFQKAVGFFDIAYDP